MKCPVLYLHDWQPEELVPGPQNNTGAQDNQDLSCKWTKTTNRMDMKQTLCTWGKQNIGTGLSDHSGLQQDWHGGEMEIIFPWVTLCLVPWSPLASFMWNTRIWMRNPVKWRGGGAKEAERISCYHSNRHHDNYLINEPLMNPTNMVLVKSCCSNYQSFIHPVLAGAAWAAWRSLWAVTDGREQLAEWMAGKRVPGSRSIGPPSQLPWHSSTATVCHPIHLTLPHRHRVTQLAPCHRHRQHSQAVCRVSSPPPCYAFSLQKATQKIKKQDK